MELVAIVIAVALIEYSVFGMLVGKARGTYGIDAPAITGHPVFERYYRVQQNTLENLVLFIPGMIMFAQYVRADVAAGLGILFIVGRFLRGRPKIPESWLCFKLYSGTNTGDRWAGWRSQRPVLTRIQEENHETPERNPGDLAGDDWLHHHGRNHYR